MALLLNPIKTRNAVMVCAMIETQELNSLARKWGKSEKEVMELIDLYRAHKHFGYHQTILLFSEMTYEQAHKATKTACMG